MRKKQSYWKRLLMHIVDRKSTRLNSSHSQISYAVFCLKKKEDTHRWCSTCYACRVPSTIVSLPKSPCSIKCWTRCFHSTIVWICSVGEIAYTAPVAFIG